jgi:hypoxanthine phosphoribosyltransferase
MSELRTIYTADEIQMRIRELAARVSEDYRGKDLVLVGILKGAAFLLADLARALEIPAEYEFVDVTTTPGDRGEVVQLSYATHFSVAGKHLLILKDVLHSGVTENYLITHLSQQRPASMELLALVDKPQFRAVDVAARYAVFSEVPEGFLVGYGLGGGSGEHVNRPDLCLVEEDD